MEDPFPTAHAVAVDIETTGLNWQTDDILLIAVSDGETSVTLPVTRRGDGYENQEEIRNLLQRLYTRTILAHNSPFDLVWLDARFNCGYPDRVHDTQVCEQMLTAGLPREDTRGEDTAKIPLRELAKKYLGVDLDKRLQTSFVGQQTELTDEQREYAAEDARILVPIARAQYKEISRLKLHTIWEIEQRVCPVFCSMKRRGILLSPDHLQPVLDEAQYQMERQGEFLREELSYFAQELRIAKFDAEKAERDAYEAACEHEAERLEREWADYLVITVAGKYAHSGIQSWRQDWFDQTVDKREDKPKGQKRYVKARLKEWRAEHPRPSKPKLTIEPINLGSGPQLKFSLSEYLGEEVADVQASTIEQLRREQQDDAKRRVLTALLEYKKSAKLIQAFGERLLVQRDMEGAVHAEFSQYGTATGRPSASRPNVLQIPAKDRIRQAFRARPGYVLVVCDFSQMELRLLAEMAQDPVLSGIFQRGEDAHTGTAKEMFGVEEPSPQQRKTAKTVNFLTSYGGGAGKLQQSLAEDEMFHTLDECRDFLNAWRKRFKRSWALIRRLQHDGVQHGYTETPLGRKRFYVPQEGDYQGRIERQASNFPIQGSNADISKVAMCTIQRLLEPLDGYVLLQVYDEIVAEVPKMHAKLGAWIVRESMIQAASNVLKVVPVKVDCSITRSWSEEDTVDLTTSD